MQTENPPNDRLCAYPWPVNQEKRRRDKTHAYAINVKSLKAPLGEWQVIDSLIGLLVDLELKVS